MNEAQKESFQTELKNKRICRFCMTQNEPLTNIYSRENRLKSSAPLPLQVMACVSIEVFTNDGMPNTICDLCRMLMEHCYRFKQMCKKADTALRQYPLTGTWPNALDMPKIPEELATIQYPQLKQKPKSEPSEKSSASEVATSPTISTQTAPVKKVAATPGRPKLLNKNSVRILNKNAQTTLEPILSQPIIKRDDAGNVEIVTEIIEQTKYEEPDPVKNATQVETNVFPCPHCERSFPLRQLLDIHIVNHTRERSFACQVCEKRFFSKYDLGKHMLIHTGEKPFECVVCKKAFTRSTLLHRHEKIHTDQPKFLCVYCEKPFLSKEELDKHTERHKKHRPFSCKICGKCFAFKQGLERHEVVHAKNQPYPCQYCDLSFPTPSKLSRHLTAHAGERPFPCRLCPKSYLLSHHLTRHMRSHTGSGSYSCYDCEKTFKSRDDLIYHSAVHATQTLVCPLCKEQFENLDLVTEHIKLHAEGEQYACEFCDLIFMTADKLQDHGFEAHADDLAVYEEHTKNNIAANKKEPNFTDDSQDTGNEEGEVIEEFIIEEYHGDHDANNAMEIPQNVFVKEQTEVVLGKDIVVSTSKGNQLKAISFQRTSNSEQRLSKDSTHTQEAVEYDGDFEEMEIEALEKDEEADFNNEAREEVVVEEPPPKMTRIATKTLTSQEVKSKTTKEPPKPTVFTRRSLAEKLAETPKTKQPTITSVLKQLPKSVTCIKKEKTPSEKSATEKPAPEKSPEVKEIKILNERIIRKGAPQILNKNAPSDSGKQHEKVRQLQKRTEPDDKSNSSAPPAKQIKTESPSTPTGTKKLVEMVIGDRKVKVQKIMMTKAEVAAMAKEGKIEMKGGTMILKQEGKSLSGRIISKATSSSESSK